MKRKKKKKKKMVLVFRVAGLQRVRELGAEQGRVIVLQELGFFFKKKGMFRKKKRKENKGKKRKLDTCLVH
jgi:hypothetical protein